VINKVRKTEVHTTKSLVPDFTSTGQSHILKLHFELLLWFLKEIVSLERRSTQWVMKCQNMNKFPDFSWPFYLNSFTLNDDEYVSPCVSDNIILLIRTLTSISMAQRSSLKC